MTEILTDETKHELLEEYTVWEEKYDKQGNPLSLIHI